ncbi:hypothetical protein LINPERPRIM_LOCUS6118 [Linum perenne]
MCPDLMLRDENWNGRNQTSKLSNPYFHFPSSRLFACLMEAHVVIDEANQQPRSGGFDLNLIPDDPIDENHSETSENTVLSPGNLKILQGHGM